MLRSLIIILGFMLGTAGGAALAQIRPIPADAVRGTLTHVNTMDVTLDGKATRLSPGAQIRDADNRLVLPTQLPPQSKVKYLLDGAGFVHRVWILSAQEIAQPDPKK